MITSSSSRNYSIGPPEKLSLGTGEQNRAGRFLRILSIERRSSQSPGVRNQERKGGDRHG